MTRLPNIRARDGRLIVGVEFHQQYRNHAEIWEMQNGKSAVRIINPNRTRMANMMRVPRDYVQTGVAK